MTNTNGNKLKWYNNIKMAVILFRFHSNICLEGNQLAWLNGVVNWKGFSYIKKRTSISFIITMNYSCAGPIENNCTIFIFICKHKTLKPTNILVLVTKTSRHTFSPCITFKTNIIMKVTAFLEQKLIKCKTTFITIHVVSHFIKVLFHVYFCYDHPA